jgi:hypothetical protein
MEDTTLDCKHTRLVIKGKNSIDAYGYKNGATEFQCQCKTCSEQTFFYPSPEEAKNRFFINIRL